MNKEFLVDFINYGIIAVVFLVVPYSPYLFLTIIFQLIFDLIALYIIEKKEQKNSFNLEEDYRFDHWEG